MNTRVSRAAVLLALTCVAASNVCAQSASDHTNWCFAAETDNRLVDQPMDRGNCAALVAGGVAAFVYGHQEAGSLILTRRQNQWARYAAQMACAGGDIGNQVAVRVIQACQCHNPGAQRSIENNQTEVLSVLRARGGC